MTIYYMTVHARNYWFEICKDMSVLFLYTYKRRRMDERGGGEIIYDVSYLYKYQHTLLISYTRVHETFISYCVGPVKIFLGLPAVLSSKHEQVGT